MNSIRKARQDARLLMEALAVLHLCGYGRLKLHCHVKEGLGVWRHCVFASDEFPDKIQAWPGPRCHGSIPGHAAFDGGTVEEVAESVLRRCRKWVSEAGRGHDESYVTWYREMLATYPDGILQMESAHRAIILGYGDIALPALKAWTCPPPDILSPEQLMAARDAERQKIVERARQQRRKRQRSA